MPDQPKTRAYLVAIAWGNPVQAMSCRIWIAASEAAAAAQVTDATLRENPSLPLLSGLFCQELPEQGLSFTLNQLRTGGQGAAVMPMRAASPGDVRALSPEELAKMAAKWAEPPQPPEGGSAA